MRTWEKGKVKNYYALRRNKGHVKMNQIFRESVINDRPSDYTIRDLIYSSLIYISVVDLYKSSDYALDLDFSFFKKRLLNNDKI